MQSQSPLNHCVKTTGNQSTDICKLPFPPPAPVMPDLPISYYQEHGIGRKIMHPPLE